MPDKHKSVLALLQSGSAFHNSSLSVDWGGRQGILHLRDGNIVAAEAEPLSGNGAALEIARWQNVVVSEIEADTEIKRNVTLTLQGIDNLFNKFSIKGSPALSYDDLVALDRAVLLIHQFRYQEAGKLLTELLKYNRFNYLGWLWYSRLLKKLNAVAKALAEAQRWGDHDPTVWLEVKKAGIAIGKSDGGEIKRCLYCWTPLNTDDAWCCYCKASQVIGRKPPSANVKKGELINSINRYISALQDDKKNCKTGYALAVGFFNLRRYDKAAVYLKYIVSLEPGKKLYLQSWEMLKTFVPGQRKEAGAAPVAAPQKTVTRVISTPAATSGGSAIILVIEDSPTARKVINIVLGREGFAVVECGSGEEAVGLAGSIKPSLILLDVMLPDTTGYELLPRLREFEHFSEIPVIMLTGRKGSTDRMKGLMAGSTEYLTKPFDPQKLTSAIKKYI